MKTLVLIRHAKSSWKNSGLKDIERPLKKRGRKDTQVMGRVLKDLPVTPDYIVSSPAERAFATANLVAKEYGKNSVAVKRDAELYLEPASRLLQQIHELENQYNIVFLVGHNPGLMDLAEMLTGDQLEKFPTGSVFGIEFQCDSWQEAGTENAKKIFFESPKKHRNGVKIKNLKTRNGQSKDNDRVPAFKGGKSRKSINKNEKSKGPDTPVKDPVKEENKEVDFAGIVQPRF